jgi:hypothetical protein
MAGGEQLQVPVEWAWRGKGPGDSGYRVLSSSTGTIGGENFHDILERYSPGTLEILPQVTVNSVTPESGGSYIGMAIYEPTAGGVDRFGRDVAFTRYFCVPYEALAPGATTYLAMYETLRNIRLPEHSSAPFRVKMIDGQLDGSYDVTHALQVAGLLLTGNPVCIVDAGARGMEERLALIDAVMSVLPYGMRAGMSAATWTSSAYRGHRFRLFFSDAPRRPTDSAPEDHHVVWRSDELIIRPALVPRINPQWAEEYGDWLRPLVEMPVRARLAEQTQPASFKAVDILRMIEGVSSSAATRRWRGLAKGNRQPDRPHVRLEKPSVDRADHVVALLARFDSDFNARHTPFMELGMRQLGELLDKERPSDAERKRYQGVIRSYRLLRDGIPPRKRDAFYKIMLRTAVGDEIDYHGYLAVLEMLAGEVAHAPLLRVIDDSAADFRVHFIIQYQINGNQYPRADPMRVIDIAADPALIESHAMLVWRAVIDALGKAKPTAMADIRGALRERGFLAQRLRARAPLDLNYQARSLTELLRVLYGDHLDEGSCKEILTGCRSAPTDALLVAVCQLISGHAMPRVLPHFIEGIAGSAGLDHELWAGFARIGFMAVADTAVQATTAEPESMMRSHRRDDER